MKDEELITQEEFHKKSKNLTLEFEKMFVEISKKEDWHPSWAFHMLGDVCHNLMRASLLMIYEMDNNSGEFLLRELIESLRNIFHEFKKEKNINLN